jgi:hypothetical protein
VILENVVPRLDSCILAVCLQGVVQIHGAMTQKARSRALERFIADPTVTVFALSLRSGAVGLTLTAASRCYLLEPCLNEGTELQAVNRIHRLGQTKKVQIVTFVSKNSVEQRLLQLRAERAAAAAASTDPTAAATEGPAGGTAAHPAAQASAQDAAVSQPSKRRAGDKRKSLSTNQVREARKKVGRTSGREEEARCVRTVADVLTDCCA